MDHQTRGGNRSQAQVGEHRGHLVAQPVGLVDERGTPRLAVLRGQSRQRGVHLVPGDGGTGDGAAVVKVGGAAGGGLPEIDQLRQQEKCRLLHRPAAREPDVGEAAGVVVGERTLCPYLDGQPEALRQYPGQLAALAGQDVALGIGEVFTADERVLHQLAAQRPPRLVGELRIGRQQLVGVAQA